MIRLTGAWRYGALALLVTLAARPTPLHAHRDGSTTTPPPPPTAAPTALSAQTHGATVVLNWRPVAEARGYRVFRRVVGVSEAAPLATVGASRYWDSGVRNGTAYLYSVAAVNRGGVGPQSTELRVVPLAAPQGLVGTAGDRQVALTWQPSVGATRYDVFRTTWGDHPWSRVGAGVMTTAFVDTGLVNGTKYVYRVQALTDGGASAKSHWVAAKPMPPAPTTAPTNLVSELQNDAVVLRWDAVPSATSYLVFTSTTATFGPEPFATVTMPTFRHPRPGAGTTLFFKVLARNASGNGPFSATVSVSSTATPLGVSAVAGDAQVTVSWTAVPGATAYNVYRGTTSGGQAAVPVGPGITGTSLVDRGLMNGTPYFYRVTALGIGGESGRSAEVRATPVPPAPASAPTNLTASLAGEVVTLTWTPVPGATSYRVFRSATTAFGTEPLATVATPPFSQPGPAQGVTFWYRVAARNAGGDGPFSAAVSVTRTPPPAAPTGVSAVPGDTQVTISWLAVTGATRYNVYRGTVAGGQATTPVAPDVTGLSVGDRGLVNGTPYFYRVTAVGDGGESARSIEVGATPVGAAPPPDPTTLSAFRLLRQATWGPRPGEVDRIVANGPVGVDVFLAEQFAATPSVYPDTLLTQALEVSQEHFMQLAMTGPDQLRQRMAWALHKIWVASAVEVNSTPGILTYYRLLMDGAFGNYRDLMRAVTLTPAMGRYLNMVNNRAESVTGVPANENYARELMQLFTLGLTALNANGTPVLDATGRPVPAYSEADVKALARILTGWTYGDGNPTTVPTGAAPVNFGVPMEPVARYHDVTEKTFLGERFPAGQSAQQDLDQALDVIFQHPNVGPFVARQLIQQLVTSNPSTTYVADVAGVFNSSGTGRGDLGAVVRAILRHGEASVTAPTSGKLAEPVLFVVSQLRALNATVTDHPFMSDKVAEMGQNVFFPPSVFSYFSPGYRVRGTGTPPLGGPEFQGLTSVTSLVRANFVGSLLGGRFGTAVTVDYTPFLNRAAAPVDLVDFVALTITGGRLTTLQRNAIVSAVTAIPAGAPLERVHTALYLTLVPGLSQVDR